MNVNDPVTVIAAYFVIGFLFALAFSKWKQDGFIGAAVFFFWPFFVPIIFTFEFFEWWATR